MKTDWSVLAVLLLGALAGCATPRAGSLNAALAIAEPLRGDAVSDAGDAVPTPPAGESARKAPARPLILTVEVAVEEALAYSRAVKRARLVEEIGGTFETEARAGLLPRIDFRGTYQRVDQAPKAVAPELGTSFSVGPDELFGVAFNMNFPVFAFGRHLNTFRAAALEHKRSEADRRATEADTAAAVTAAAFDMLETIRGIEVARDIEKALERQVKDARARYEARTVTKDALLEAEVQHAQTKRAREKLESLVPIRRMQLNFLLGRPAHVKTQVVDAPEARAPIWQQKSLEREALDGRPELQAAELNVSAAHRRLRAVIGGELGELRGNLAWETDDSDFRSPSDHVTLFLSLDIPLFTGGARSARIRRVRYEYEIARLQLRDLQTAIRTEVAQAFRNVTEAYDDIAVAKRNVDSQTESLRIQQEKFRSGRATSREVLDSTSLLTSTQIDHVTAIYDYNIALRELHRARGADPRLPPFYELAAAEKDEE